MPYNTTAIPPRKEVTGSAQLPLARVKKIIALDSDIAMCSNNAAFVITLATEMFIQYLAEKGHDVVKSERKPRRNIQYKDLASAVARHDRLEFLSDIVPQTQTYKAVKESKKARQAANGTETDLPAGQTTIDGSGKGSIPTNGTIAAATNGNGFGMVGSGDDRDDTMNDEDDSGSADPNAQLEMEIRGRESFGSVKDMVETNGYVNGNGHGHGHGHGHGGSGDVEMS